MATLPKEYRMDLYPGKTWHVPSPGRPVRLEEKIISCVIDKFTLEHYPKNHHKNVIKTILRQNGFVDFAPIEQELMYDMDQIKFTQRIWVRSENNKLETSEVIKEYEKEKVNPNRLTDADMKIDF